MANKNYSDRRLVNVGYNRHNPKQSEIIAKIQQDFQQNGLFSRVVARTPRYDWRIIFNNNRNEITNQAEIHPALFGVPTRTVGITVWHPNQQSLSAKNEQLGQIGIYPNHINSERGDIDELYWNILTTAYHESSHAERGLKHPDIPQNSLAEEYRAFRREEVIRRTLDGKERVIPSLQTRAELFDERILPAYYPDLIDGNYSLGKIPKFILEGKHRLPFEQKKPSQKGIDGGNFANIIDHARKTSNSQLLARYGYQTVYDRQENELEVFKDEKSIIIALKKDERWEIDSEDLKLTESDIINSYKIAQEIENQQVKTRSNNFGSRSIATNYHAPNKQIVATKSMRPMLLAGLQKAKASPSNNRRQTSQKLLSRNKKIENAEKVTKQKSAFSRYLSTKTNHKSTSSKQIEL